MRFIRGGICGLIAFAVLASGAVEPWSQAILEMGSALLVLLWAVSAVRRGRVEVHWNWLLAPLLCLIAFCIAQGAQGFTVYAYVSTVELLLWAACLLLVFLANESIRTDQQIHSFQWFLLTLGFFVSLFGIVQHLIPNGKLYWLRPLRWGGSPLGPFVNHNHFAGFVVLIVPLGLALILGTATRRDKLPLLYLFTALPIGALFLSGSRGGMASFLLEVVLLGFLATTNSPGRRRLVEAAGFAVLAGALVLWLGVGPARWQLFGSPFAEIPHDRRISMFKDTLRIFLDHRWIGTGLGTLQTVYPRYESYYDGAIVTHAHNDYLELLSDTGLAGGMCGLAFVVILFWRGIQNWRAAESPSSRSFCAGAVAACGGMLLHSLVDFNLHIPSNALLFLVLACLVTSTAQEKI